LTGMIRPANPKRTRLSYAATDQIDRSVAPTRAMHCGRMKRSSTLLIQTIKNGLDQAAATGVAFRKLTHAVRRVRDGEVSNRIAK
jgi:hypothetical protein